MIGEKVRYDGGDKASRFCLQQLAKYVEYLPICPEVASGMGVPRPTIRLQGDVNNPRAVVWVSDEDVTERLANVATLYQAQLEQVSGYLLCTKSPSCGLASVKVYANDSDDHYRRGSGIFAQHLRNLFPALPMEENERLEDAELRKNFLTRLYVYHDWQQLPKPLTKHALIQFQHRHKLLMLAHHHAMFIELEHKLAKVEALTKEFEQDYVVCMMNALAQPANHNGHERVVRYVQKFPNADWQSQSYFQPYPAGLQ